MQKPLFLLKLIIIIMSVAVIGFSVVSISLYKTVDEIKKEKHITPSNDQITLDNVNVDELNELINNIDNKINDLEKKLDEYNEG